MIRMTTAFVLALLAVPAAAQIVPNREPAVALTNMDTRATTVPAGTTASLPLIVDAASGGDLFDVVSSDPAVAISLVLPGGAVIDAANAEAQGFTYEVLPADTVKPAPFSARGTHTLIGLAPGSIAGTYQVRATAPATVDNALVTAAYFSSSKVRAGLMTDAPLYNVGDTVLLSGFVFDGPSPVAGAAVIARIGDPADAVTPPAEVGMPDGGPFDDRAGDGIYTGEFTAAAAGTFMAALRVTGVSSAGVSFSRTATTTFRVLPRRAAFANFADAGADDDFDGLTDRVVITANVDVQVAGTYQFGVTLEASSGAQISGSATASLDAGSAPLDVSFSVADLRRLGADGPYALKDAILADRDDADGAAVDFRDEAGTTAAYVLSSLGPGDVSDAGPDVTAPVIDAVADIVVDSISPTGAVVTFALPAVVDDIDLAPNVSARPPSGSRFSFGDTTVTVTATDGSGNSSAAAFTVTVRDATPPSIQCGAAGSSWLAADASIVCTASDSGSGLANAGDASFALVTAVPAGTETINALTGARTVCDAAGNCATAGPIGGIRVDKRGPQISLLAPANAVYTVKQPVAASYACADGGAGIASCIGSAASAAPIDTNSPGTRQFTVTSVDLAGNTSTTSLEYRVSYGGTFTSLGPAGLWLGVENGDPDDTKLDVRVEILKNGVVTTTGQLNSITVGSGDFLHATLRNVAVALAAPVAYAPGDTLAVRVSTRIAAASRRRSATVRLWQDNLFVHSTAHTIVNGVSRRFYLSSGSQLKVSVPIIARPNFVAVRVDRAGSGNPFKALGTWSIAF